jgi:putative hydrolase of the HAD superfamily
MSEKSIKAMIFDWGDTVMRDIPGKEGAMYTWDSVEWIPYAEDALKTVFPFFTCCIATSAGHSGKEEMIKALSRVGADQYFHYFFSSKELGFAKPDPRFFISIADKIGIAAGQCMMTGNLYEKDIVGAKNAGMCTLFFNENKLPGEFPAADYMIYSFSDFSKVLSQI